AFVPWLGLLRSGQELRSGFRFVSNRGSDDRFRPLGPPIFHRPCRGNRISLPRRRLARHAGRFQSLAKSEQHMTPVVHATFAAYQVGAHTSKSTLGVGAEKGITFSYYQPLQELDTSLP